MKKIRAIGLLALILLAGIAVYLAAHSVADHLAAKAPAFKNQVCRQSGHMHYVSIENSVVKPQHTAAKLCDKLTIVNNDTRVRFMAFGKHDNHHPYDGVVGKVLDKAQRFTVSLDKPGTYRFHDHLDNKAQGTFTVR